ncbi:hypothetical protein LR48_Vigan10g216000 [Vigna angularis]|uniref:Uncharacterized protein n=1 Tax=Phaseolus angularis TaxID=3914 RepID=A0A0L9VMT0_PHAAN|nr:hypothetical protein LR48_Vigan10g216000 [Vigna angularis]
MGYRATKKRKASSSVDGRRRRRSPTLSPSSSPPTPNNELFSSDEQYEKYVQHFLNREILESKYLEDGYFEGKNIQFYDILAEVGLTEFLSLRRHYHPELVRVFYSNMSISDTGVIRSEEHHSRPASTPPRPATSSSMQHFTYTAAIRTVSNSNSITPPTRSSSHGGGRQSSTLLKQPPAGKESAAPHKNTAAEVVFINMKIQGQFTVSREKRWGSRPK